MSKKNDFIFIESDEIRYETYYFLVIAGGRLRIPVWLVVLSYALLALLVLVAGVVLVSVTNGESWGLIAWSAVIMVALPLTVVFLVAIGGGIVAFVEVWRKVLRGGYKR